MSGYRSLLRFISAAAALGLFIGSWAALHHGWLSRNQIVDTPVYENYGDQMANWQAPYLDFGVEYPPGALPVFLVPSIQNEGDPIAYRRSFETIMAACGGVLMISVAITLGALGVSLPRYCGALALAAVSPVLLGSVILSRFDLWPTALAAAALAALVSGRFKVGHALLGLGIVAKLWPGVLLPLAVAHAWRTRGRREALVSLGVTVAVVALFVAPFAAYAPHGVWSSFERQATRPLQIESLGAALIVALHHVAGTGAAMASGHGSQNIAGRTADVVGALQSLVQIAALVLIWVVFARRERSREEFVQYAAAAVVAFVALGKVLSPQYLIWLIPLVPLVRRWSAALLYVAALVLTQVWFPQRYWDYALRFDSTISWIVLVRDVVLVALLAVLLVPADRRLRVPLVRLGRGRGRSQAPAVALPDSSVGSGRACTTTSVLVARVKAT